MSDDGISESNRLDEQLRMLRVLLVNQELDPNRLEGKALAFAKELATVHGLEQARNYVDRNHTAALTPSQELQ